MIINIYFIFNLPVQQFFILTTKLIFQFYIFARRNNTFQFAAIANNPIFYDSCIISKRITNSLIFNIRDSRPLEIIFKLSFEAFSISLECDFNLEFGLVLIDSFGFGLISIISCQESFITFSCCLSK